MIRLFSAGALIVAIGAPAFAADFDVRAGGPVAVERQVRVYHPAEVVTALVVVGPPAVGPLTPRRYVNPADSYARYGGPVPAPAVTIDDGYVDPDVVHPGRVYLIDPVGPVCEPGALVRGPDGRSYLCQ